MIIKTAVQKQWNIIYPGDANYTVIDSAEVDGTIWYSVKCSIEVGNWVRTQPSEHWVKYVESIYDYQIDMDQELLVLLKLTWGQ
jgi:hypothetical protein